jgi:deoxyinosine 3'endonuclease (endonuclease V)
VETGEDRGGAVFVAADVHYLPCGGARAAAVVAADPAFSRLAGDRIAVVADVAPYQPGQFYLRELPPLRAVMDGFAAFAVYGIGGLVVPLALLFTWLRLRAPHARTAAAPDGN